ncbi:unnamed protein product [Linum tenue]|uniref:Phytosulfokine n=1 Tax=Linum tenue TaxID=586396 RepID=A0AAV0PEK5_9ROSI|nr:unnamed protein product [Linum tenue]
MKRNSYTYTPSSLPFLLLFAFLLLSSSFFSHSASARPLLVLDTAASSQMAVGSSDGGETELVLVSREDQKAAAAAAAADLFANSLKEEDFSTLMGAEELEKAEAVCGEKDEDCLARRMVAEAHLDYIYTQHHKNP